MQVGGVFWQRVLTAAKVGMTQACDIQTNSGAAITEGGGKSANRSTWTRVIGPTWSNATTYGVNDIANGVDGKVYHSLVPGNRNNEPSASPTQWARGFPCLVWRDNRFSEDQQQAGVAQAVSRFRGAFPLGTMLDPKNRIALIDGPTYEIEGVDAWQANQVQVLADLKLVH